MRDFKKHFFETLIQVTILAALFRENSRLHHNHNHLLNGQDLVEQIGRRRLLNFSPFTADDDSIELASNLSLISSSPFNSAAYRNKQAAGEDFLLSQDLKRLGRGRGGISLPPLPGWRTQQRLVVLPSSFYASSANPKGINQLSDETRVLLNSIEFNNQLSKEEMDFEIQAIIEQDIDLGIKKSLNYDFELATGNVNGDSAANTPQSDYEFFKYFNENAAAGKLDLDQTDFYFKELQESQKNEDILSTANLFQGQNIPDGYKLVLEEDTGECILLMIKNDTLSPDGTSQLQLQEAVNLPVANFSNNVTTSQIEVVEQSTDELLNNEREPFEMVNIRVQMSVFLKEEALSLLHSSQHGRDEQSQQQQQHPVVPFLSQTSVLNELNKLNTNGPPPLATANTLDSAMNESLNNLDDNLLDETWISHFLLQSEAADAEQRPAAAAADSQTPLAEQSAEAVDFLIDDDKMLSSLNANNSILNNETQSLSRPNLPPLQENTENVGALLNNTLENYFNNNESLEYLFDESIFDETESSSQMSAVKAAAGVHHHNHTATATSRLLNHSISINPIDFDEKLTLSSTLISASDNSTASAAATVAATTNALSSLLSASNDDEAKNLIKSHDDFTFALKQEAFDMEDNILVDKPTGGHHYPTMTDNSRAALSGFIHNHTYLSTTTKQGDDADSTDAELHPYSYKSKLKKMLKSTKNESSEMSKNRAKDVAILRQNKITLSLEQVVDSNADDFGELIKQKGLTTEQVNVIKDIRRRAKNKVAAQICRKRKLDSIDSLKEDVGVLRDMKSVLLDEYNSIQSQIKEMTSKFDTLYQKALGDRARDDSNDPIVAFLNSLKDLKPRKEESLKAAESSSSSKATTAAKRDRTRTFNSNNSSDLDSFESSDNENSSSKLNSYDDYIEEEEEDDAEEEEEYGYEDDEGEDEDEEEFFEDDENDYVRESQLLSSNNKNKKFKKN